MSTPTEVAALVTATNNLTQTVIDKRTEITNTVNTKIQQLDNWKSNLTPDSVAAEPRYVSAVDLTGLPTDRYYPVWWQGFSAKYGCQKIFIARHARDDSDLDPFGDGGPIAGLLLEIEQVGNANNSPRYCHVKTLSQILRKTVRNFKFGLRCADVLPVDGQLGTADLLTQKIHPQMSGLYLRGGLSYQVISNTHKELSYATEIGPVDVSIIESGPMIGRWTVKSYPIDDPFLGAEYDNFSAPYTAFPYPVI